MNYEKLSKAELISILEDRDSDNKYKLRDALNKQLDTISSLIDNTKITSLDDDNIDLVVKMAEKGEKIAKGLNALSGAKVKEEREDDYKYLQFLPKE